MTESSSPFDPQKDAESLHESLQGDDKQIENIINIICQRTNDQRQQIKEKYISNLELIFQKH